MTQTTDQHSGATTSGAAAAPTSGLPDDPGGQRDRRAGIVPVLAFAGITVAVMQTLLVPVIKDLPTLLSSSPSNATWVMTSTLLAGAVATPIMGRLGDLAGKRRMLLVSLAVMVVGSLICGFTDSLVVMIAGRALQGFAMGAIPLGIGLMRDELPPARLGGAMALMSSSIGVGGGLALPGAAFVAQHFDWHALFFTAAGLGVLAILLTLLFVPESAVRAQGRFDLPGAVGLSGGLILLLLPVTKGSDWGWGSPATLGLFGGGVVVLVLWGLMELRSAAPLVDLRTTARREVLLTNLASIMVGVAFYAISLVLPQLLQLPAATGYGLGKSMLTAGLCVAPLGLTMMLTAPVYAKLAAKYGPKVSLLLGMVIIGIGYGAGIGLMSAAWQTIVISVVVGAGIGLAYSSLPALIIGAVDASETGAANGLNTLMRSIGTSVSSAVIGMVLAHTAQVTDGVPVPTMHGFRVSFLIATAAVAGGVLLAAFLPSRTQTRPSHLRAASHSGEPLPDEGKALARQGSGLPVGTAATTLETLADDGSFPGGEEALVGVSAGVTHHAPQPSTGADTLGRPGFAGAPSTGTLGSAGISAGISAEIPAGTAGIPAGPPTALPAGVYARRPATAGQHAVPTGSPGGESGFHGRVLDAEGVPVARAKVTLIDARGRQAGAALSDAQGQYALAVPDSGTYVLAARAAGHAPRASAATYSGHSTRVEVDLPLSAHSPAAGQPRTTG